MKSKRFLILLLLTLSPPAVAFRQQAIIPLSPETHRPFKRSVRTSRRRFVALYDGDYRNDIGSGEEASFDSSQGLKRRKLLLSVRNACLLTSFSTTRSAAAEIGRRGKSKRVEFLWNDVPTGTFPMAINGEITSAAIRKINPAEAVVRLSYEQDGKWDKSAVRITVYQKTGTAKQETLKNAAGLGISRALDIGDRIGDNLKQNLNAAGLVESRSRSVGNQTYFDFELRAGDTSLPDRNGGVQNDTARYLISTTVLNRRLYVFLLQCNESAWRTHSRDLLRMQSSFQVELI